MNDKEICVDIIIAVLRELKNNCINKAYCRTDCPLYDREYATCFLRAYPCDYELEKIEKGIVKIIENELKEGETI